MFKILHDEMGHPGRDKTLVLHRQRCYWPSMTKDTEDMVKRCRRCVCRKSRTTTAPLTPIITSQPLELVCLDYLLVEPSEGYEHLLVITDHFTKFAKVVATRNESARTTARALYDNFLTVYGIPKRILSDQGRSFESKVIKELCAITGIQKSRTTAYHAMCNGACERFNQSILKMIGTLANDQKSKWKSYLPSLVHSYNCTPHETTDFSPYELMFGRKPMLPVDAEIQPRANGEGNLTKFVDDLRKQVEYVNTIAKKRMEAKAANSKALYDRKSTNATLEVGDTVLVRKTAFSGREKVGDKWIDEVHVVISRPDPNIAVYTVKPQSGGGRVRTLHRNLLLPIFVDEEPAAASPSRKSPSTAVKSTRKSERNKSKSRNISHLSSDSDSEEELFVSPVLSAFYNSSPGRSQTASSPAAAAVPPAVFPPVVVPPAAPPAVVVPPAQLIPVVPVPSQAPIPAVEVLPAPPAVPAVPPAPLQVQASPPPSAAPRRSERRNLGTLPKRFGDYVMSHLVRF